MDQISVEKVIKPVHSSFSAVCYEHTYFEAPLHIHPEYELILIEQGEGYTFVGDMTYKLAAGDFMLIGHDLPHLWLSSHEYYIKGTSLRSASVYAQFKTDIFPAQESTVEEFSSIYRLLSDSQKGLRFSGEGLERIKQQFRELPTLSGFSRLLSLYQILQDLSACPYTFLTSAHYINTYEQGKEDPIIQRAHLFMNRNYQENITLEQIAAYAGMNPSALCRYYKKHTGETLFQYLAELRISYATKLLMNKNISIGQIAYDCGYNNLSHFNRQFKAIMGKTPSEYYQQLQKHPGVFNA